MQQSTGKIKCIAFYLPQFHPIPENNKWWGEGFTEWTNVKKAHPLFSGHYQPRIPSELGYYDLRDPMVREAQAKLAQDYGIYGFCYYHYWFGNGKQLLEHPFNDVLKSKKPDFPFCLCWANETWSGIWFGKANKTLIKQSYPGKKDYVNHFSHLLQAFQDERYIKIENKPLFNVYMPMNIPNLREFTDTFRELAYKAGLKGLYLMASRCPLAWNPKEHDFDGVIGSEFSQMRYILTPHYRKLNFFIKLNFVLKQLIRTTLSSSFDNRIKPIIVEYSEAIKHLLPEKNTYEYDYFPCVIPNWDNTPRAGNRGLVFHNSTPQLFAEHLSAAIKKVQYLKEDKKIIFIKSWNEWAESNYLEPDQKFGKQYLVELKKALLNPHL